MNETVFETAQEAAVRLGVTVRAIQKSAAEGRIPGAKKHGKMWLIPKDATVSEKQKNEKENGIPDVYQLTPFRVAMPLLNSNYPVGKCMEYIEAMPDPDDRNIALAEYYFFSGRAEESSKMAEPYLDSHDPALRFSSNLIATFANLALGRVHLSHYAIHNLQEQVHRGLRSDAPPRLHAIGIFTATAASVLLHLPVPPIPPLEEYISYLPDGLKLYACYILAHKAYLEQDFSRCLAVADMGLALIRKASTIAEIYAHIVAAIALVNMKRVEDAKKRIALAWNLAKPDDLLQPFGEHHGLLQGLIEIYFKNDHPKDFTRIIDITYAFSAGWRKVHKSVTDHDVADNLTTIEFTIAMLLTRDWSYKEIAGHLGISDRQVARKTAEIYIKIGVSNTTELAKFMLK